MTSRRTDAVAACMAMIVLAMSGGLAAQESPEAPESDGPLLRVRAIDETGKAVPGAEACLIDVAYGLPITHVWTAADAGLITISADNISRFAEGETTEGDARLLVRAPDHAWSVKTVTLPVAEALDVTLSPGREITLRLEAGDDRTLPDDLEPIVYTESLGTAAWITCVQGYRKRAEEPGTAVFPARAVGRGAGAYIVRVPDGLEAFSVLVDHPGFLRAFESGSFTVGDLEDDTVAITLPKPIEITVDVQPAEDAPAEYSGCAVDMLHSPEVPGGWSFRVEQRYGDGRSFTTVLDDLAPGGYSVFAATGDEQTSGRQDRPDYCQVREWVELAAGESKDIELRLETYDEEYWAERLQGEYTLTLDIDLSGGAPAAGKPYALNYSLQKFGKQIELAKGDLPEDGILRFEGLPAGDVALIMLTVGGEYISQLYLREEDHEEEYQFSLAPAVGDPAPDFEMTTLAEGETISLSDYRGQVVLLEFWASWCGPCQEPMKHNNELMKRRGDSWHDAVAILGVSIDNEIETIRKHVDERDWNAVRQVWVDGAWKSEAVKMYAVTGVPSAFLIDAEGTITWSGHPASIDVEKEIEKLLSPD